MRWHAVDNNNDGMMRHPRDSMAWKTFDSTNMSFVSDPRNVRLGLATDGFNPFGNLSTSYSIWPIILIPYNTPPWVSMKSTSFILSTIIPGKKMPGNNIDVYMQPLVKELKELWHDGVDAYDASTREMFKLHAALMWTISDFPGLGTLSGWNTYTGRACPTCNFDSIPCRLPHSRKWCFMGHRRFLDRRHRFRLNRIQFNGEQDMRNPPKLLSGSEILEQVKNINVTFGQTAETSGKGKRSRGPSTADYDRLKLELQASNARVEALEGEVAKVRTLEEQVAFLMQQARGQCPIRFDEAANLHSPAEAMRSSSASHAPTHHGPTSTL